MCELGGITFSTVLNALCRYQDEHVMFEIDVTADVWNITQRDIHACISGDDTDKSNAQSPGGVKSSAAHRELRKNVVRNRIGLHIQPYLLQDSVPGADTHICTQ